MENAMLYIAVMCTDRTRVLPCVRAYTVRSYHLLLQNQVDARSKAWVCGRPLAGISGSNPADSTDVCLL